ncbi:MAG: tRNA pseudouridine(55) synthase TruB [Rhodanobacteraceae bacterium]
MKLRDSRDVHGILLFDKPQGFSSNQALQIVRRLYGAAKAGHTGSLDPLATGLLPICFGEATKIAGLLLGSHKAYVTEAKLGETTETDDAEGAVLETRAVPEIDDATIRAALATLTGRVTQLPPAYSAIKQGGEPLYRRARRGEAVKVPAREVDVHAFNLIGRAPSMLTLEVECGSGTYVRSLVRDLGERLGCGAHVASLRRLWVEPFLSPRMTTLETLEALASSGGTAALDALLMPLEAGLAGYPHVTVDDATAVRLRHGLAAYAAGAASGQLVALDPAGRAVALVESADGRLRSLRGFNPVTAADAQGGPA